MKKRISITLEEETIREIKDFAKSTGRNTSSSIERLIIRGLKDFMIVINNTGGYYDDGKFIVCEEYDITKNGTIKIKD